MSRLTDFDMLSVGEKYFPLPSSFLILHTKYSLQIKFKYGNFVENKGFAN